MTDSKDLGAGQVSPEEIEFTRLDLREEKQRLRWKTAVLWGAAVTIFVFYVAALWSVRTLLVTDPPYRIEFVHGLIVALLLAVPTLVAILLFKIVGKDTELKPVDFDSHPLIKLIRELFATIKALK